MEEAEEASGGARSTAEEASGGARSAAEEASGAVLPAAEEASDAVLPAAEEEQTGQPPVATDADPVASFSWLSWVTRLAFGGESSTDDADSPAKLQKRVSSAGGPRPAHCELTGAPSVASRVAEHA